QLGCKPRGWRDSPAASPRPSPQRRIPSVEIPVKAVTQVRPVPLPQAYTNFDFGANQSNSTPLFVATACLNDRCKPAPTPAHRQSHRSSSAPRGKRSFSSDQAGSYVTETDPFGEGNSCLRQEAKQPRLILEPSVPDQTGLPGPMPLPW